MYCANCGRELPDNAMFCDVCGQKTAGSSKLVCGVCGEEVNASDEYCPHCGGYIYSGVNAVPPRPIRTRPAKSSSNTAAAAAIAALIVIAAAVGVAVGVSIYTSNDDDSLSSETAAAVQTQAPAQSTAEPEVKTPEPQTGEYLFNSDTELITTAYLSTKSQAEVRLILNEIYARRGYIFNLQEYSSYFSSKSWYTPRYSTIEETERQFNSIERKNMETIVDYEKYMGYR